MSSWPILLAYFKSLWKSKSSMVVHSGSKMSTLRTWISPVLKNWMLGGKTKFIIVEKAISCSTFIKPMSFMRAAAKKKLMTISVIMKPLSPAFKLSEAPDSI